MSVQYGLYSDSGADGFGQLLSEELDLMDIESKILSILARTGPYVNSTSFIERPDYTIKKLVDCVPHPDHTNPVIMKYSAEPTAKLVLRELQKVEKRIAQVREAWKKVLKSNTEEE